MPVKSTGKEKRSADSADEQKSWLITELGFKAHGDTAQTYCPKGAVVPGLWDVPSLALPITWEFFCFIKQL